MSKKHNIEVLSAETILHLLKHFYAIDDAYINSLRKYVKTDDINNALLSHSSKFFKSFVTNPTDLINKIEQKLTHQSLQEGKNEITLFFKDIIGFDLLIDKTLQDNNYSLTRQLNIVLIKEKNRLEIITIFPGEYAPALPNNDFMSKEENKYAELFWHNKKIGNFSNFEVVERKIHRINDAINKSWHLRYNDYDRAIEILERAIKDAIEINYVEGKKYADFCKTAVMLTRKTATEEIFTYLIDFYNDIKTTKNNQAIVRCLLTMAAQYDLFGMYNKGIEACIKGINIAKENNLTTELGDLYSTIGFINIRILDYRQAEQYFIKSIEIRKTLQDKAAIAASYNQLARVNMLNKQYDVAEKYYLKSIEIRQENKYYAALIWSYIGLASLFIEKKEYHKALNYYNAIKAIKTKHNIDEKQSTIIYLQGIGKIKNNLHQFDEAKKLFLKALEIAKDLSLKPLQYQLHFELYQSYKNLKNNEKALFHFENFHKIKESVINEESANKLKQQQISFAIERLEKEKEIEHLKNIELKKANDEILKQKEEIEEINKEIAASISYAQRIQAAVLPQSNMINETLNDYFILFMPKDIVSGDFYWFKEIKEKNIVVAAAVDCTGHGIPGAFMSMLGITFLNEIVGKYDFSSSGEILNNLRKYVIESLKQTGREGEQKDGMDISLIVWYKDKNYIEFSGANNPLYIITRNARNLTGFQNLLGLDGFYEIKPDKMPIGIHVFNDDFAVQRIDIEKGDCIYMFSDGYADQFGGPKGKKFKYQALKNTLLEIASAPMAEQKHYLKNKIEKWMGYIDKDTQKVYQQIDDIVVFGIRF